MNQIKEALTNPAKFGRPVTGAEFRAVSDWYDRTVAAEAQKRAERAVDVSDIIKSLTLEQIEEGLTNPSTLPRPVTQGELHALEAWYGRAKKKADEEAAREAARLEQEAIDRAERDRVSALQAEQMRQLASRETAALGQLKLPPAWEEKRIYGDRTYIPRQFDLDAEDPLENGSVDMSRVERRQEMVARDSVADTWDAQRHTVMDAQRIRRLGPNSEEAMREEQYLAHADLFKIKRQHPPEELMARAYGVLYDNEKAIASWYGEKGLTPARRVALEVAVAHHGSPEHLADLRRMGFFTTFTGKRSLNERAAMLEEIYGMLQIPVAKVRNEWQEEQQRWKGQKIALGQRTAHLTGLRQEYINVLRNRVEYLDYVASRRKQAENFAQMQRDPASGRLYPTAVRTPEGQMMLRSYLAHLQRLEDDTTVT